MKGQFIEGKCRGCNKPLVEGMIQGITFALKHIECSPIEFFHNELQKEFHVFRRQKTEDTKVEMNGIEFNKIVVAAKKTTKKEYQLKTEKK